MTEASRPHDATASDTQLLSIQDVAAGKTTQARQTLIAGRRDLPARVPDRETQTSDRRLQVFALIAVSFFSLGMVIAVMALIAGRDPARSAVYLGLCAIMVVGSVVTLGLLQARRLGHRGRFGAGVTLVLSGALVMAVAEVMVIGDALSLPRIGVSGIGIWVLLFPLLVPCRVVTAATVGLCAATTLPAVYVARLLVHRPGLDLVSLIDWFAPVYVCAGLAILCAWSLNRTSSALAAAQAELRELGRYRLGKQLGKGGMGEVWSARHRLLPREVAIKFIKQRDQPAERDDLVDRFDAEAHAIAQLVSPHTVSLFDYGITEAGERYFVMERIDGLTLADLIERSGTMPPARVLQVLVQVCRSLEEAHAKGLVHRDIKPGNIMLRFVPGSGDWVTVLDFGLVAGVAAVGPGRIGGADSRGSRLFGTVGYMPPEMILGDKTDARGDLYAVGVVAWYLLAGRLPYTAATMDEELSLHATAPVPELPATAGYLPPGFAEIIRRCLVKRPDDRWTDARQLREHLEKTAETMPWPVEDAALWWREWRGSSVN